MPDDELPVGPSLLAPGAREPSGAGDRLARRILVPLAVFLTVVVVVFYVIFNLGRVVGPSMLPTLRSGDMVLLTKGYKEPRRGDIVFTEVDEQGAKVEIVKRVIALPGDTVEVNNDTAIVNGVVEPARGQVVSPDQGDSVGPYRVPKGTLYVMGDNRRDSQDSRYVGPVPLSGVAGRVVAIYAPISRVRLVR